MIIRIAPWQDYAGSSIYAGDILHHPSGERGVVVFIPDQITPEDQWRVVYGDLTISRLCLQIGEQGRAVVSGEM